MAQGRKEGEEAIDEDVDIQPQGVVDLTGFMDEDELHESNNMLELEK